MLKEQTKMMGNETWRTPKISRVRNNLRTQRYKYMRVT